MMTNMRMPSMSASSTTGRGCRTSSSARMRSASNCFIFYVTLCSRNGADHQIPDSITVEPDDLALSSSSGGHEVVSQKQKKPPPTKVEGGFKFKLGKLLHHLQ